MPSTKENRNTRSFASRGTLLKEPRGRWEVLKGRGGGRRLTIVAVRPWPCRRVHRPRSGLGTGRRRTRAQRRRLIRKAADDDRGRLVEITKQQRLLTSADLPAKSWAPY